MKKWKPKPQWDRTLPLLEWLLLKKTNAGDDVDKIGNLYTIHGIVRLVQPLWKTVWRTSKTKNNSGIEFNNNNNKIGRNVMGSSQRQTPYVLYPPLVYRKALASWIFLDFQKEVRKYRKKKKRKKESNQTQPNN